MSTHIVGFYEDLTNVIFQLSSNMHLISSSGSIFQMHLMSYHILNFEGEKQAKLSIIGYVGMTLLQVKVHSGRGALVFIAVL